MLCASCALLLRQLGSVDQPVACFGRIAFSAQRLPLDEIANRCAFNPGLRLLGQRNRLLGQRQRLILAALWEQV